ncbi:BnaA01g31040D [Brassica napus]|uniref:BnaA01g31040D protein n=1 Tax=Brassica napus TaxID=3708 RepID=A0A078HFX0_BRANA|nr:BnaA01g31040D [Brassica napus]
MIMSSEKDIHTICGYFDFHVCETEIESKSRVCKYFIKRIHLLQKQTFFFSFVNKQTLYLQKSWVSYSDCCIWEGITCNTKSGAVIGLDLSCSYLSGQFHSNSSLQNLHSLTTLNLSQNSWSGQIMSSIGNLSHLTSLVLSWNHFTGFIPSSIVDLSSLTFLDLAMNHLSGQIPSLIGNLSHLTFLDLSLNHISGQIPSSIGNLSHLTNLDLFYNQISGQIPSSVGNLYKLTRLGLSVNNIVGEIPSSFGNLNHLTSLKLSTLQPNYNQFTGTIPHNITSLSNLMLFGASGNAFTGALPLSLFTTPFIEYVDLSDNQLNGNHVSATNKSQVSDPPLLSKLQLSGCGITKFPEEFVRTKNLGSLDISNNKIEGSVPGWLWTLPNLLYNITLYASDNNFMGEIPSLICDLRFVQTLDLSNNNFSGLIPRCLVNLKRPLLNLNLHQNRLHGGLPKNIFESLITLDVGHNQLTGKLPRSLIHSPHLEVLNVERNIINDTFPFWLSSLPQLKVLVIRSNAFHGPIHQTSFSKLQIIDISNNHFNGALTSDFFVKWSAMSSLVSNDDPPDEMYMGNTYYLDSVVLMNKGLEMKLQYILKIYTALDFSGNKFEGETPRSIGLLKELHVLNLSNNAFTGYIPSSLGNLTALESLDLSQNQLSGEIPQELGELSFLSYMNFSHNKLTGLVPSGTQFRRLNCTSFEGNMGLSGPSLDEICKDIHTPTPHETPELEDEEDEKEEVLSWIATLIGVIPGMTFGWVKSDETSKLGLLLGFSSPSHQTKSILVAPQETTPRLDHMFLKCLVASKQTVSEWTVHETSLAMDGYTLTEISAFCYRTENSTKTSEYVALLGHISIKDHHVQLLQQNLVSLPPATSWVIEAHNLELVLGKSGSRILKVKLEWKQKQLEDSVLPVYNVYAESVKSTDVLRSRKVLEKPRSERVFLGVSHVPAYYVSELVVDSDVKGVSFVVQPCGEDGSWMKVDDSPNLLVDLEGLS